jgi:hypothetical protein
MNIVHQQSEFYGKLLRKSFSLLHRSDGSWGEEKLQVQVNRKRTLTALPHNSPPSNYSLVINSVTPKPMNHATVVFYDLFFPLVCHKSCNISPLRYHHSIVGDFALVQLKYTAFSSSFPH